MAGETPGASNVNKRRHLNWRDDRSTNKIYASAQESVIDKISGGDRVINKAPTPVAPRRAVLNERSTDRYYAAAKQAPTAQQARKDGVHTPAQPHLPPRLAQPEHELPSNYLFVHEVDDVAVVLDEVAARLHDGDQQVFIEIANVPGLIQRVRAGLDMMVTREQITEEQYRDVRLRKAEAEAAPTDEAADAIAAMLKTLPTPKPVEVDTTPQNVVEAAEVAPPEPEPEANDDNDFLNETMPAAFQPVQIGPGQNNYGDGPEELPPYEANLEPEMIESLRVMALDPVTNSILATPLDLDAPAAEAPADETPAEAKPVRRVPPRRTTGSRYGRGT